MSSINLTNLTNKNLNRDKYNYVDLFFDFQEDPIGIAANFVNTTGNGRDIKVAYDLNAIKNSLVNLFNTSPGERFLLPDYGSDIRRFVFESVLETTARAIGRSIINSIEKWEPRIRIVQFDITGNPDLNQYDITIHIQIPFLEETFKLQGILTKSGYIFV